MTRARNPSSSGPTERNWDDLKNPHINHLTFMAETSQEKRETRADIIEKTAAFEANGGTIKHESEASG